MGTTSWNVGNGTEGLFPLWGTGKAEATPGWFLQLIGQPGGCGRESEKDFFKVL